MSKEDLKHNWSQGNWIFIEDYSQRDVTSCGFLGSNRTSCCLISRTIILRRLSCLFPFHNSVHICATGCTSLSCWKCPAVERPQMMSWQAEEDTLVCPEVLVRQPSRNAGTYLPNTTTSLPRRRRYLYLSSASE